jgi:hypothetical protein
LLSPKNYHHQCKPEADVYHSVSTPPDLPHCIPIFYQVFDKCRIYDWPVSENPHWLSPVISSAYGVNLDKRIFDKTVYTVETCDMPQ